jgi:hypothetical protein
MRAQKLGVLLVTANPGLPASARLTQLAEWLVAQRPWSPGPLAISWLDR